MFNKRCRISSIVVTAAAVEMNRHAQKCMKCMDMFGNAQKWTVMNGNEWECMEINTNKHAAREVTYCRLQAWGDILQVAGLG